MIRRSALCLALTTVAHAQEPWFVEDAAGAGVVWSYESGAPPDRHYFPEIMGGGAALLDFDGDGDLDLYLVQSGSIDTEPDVARPGNKLFKNMSVENAAAEDAAAPLFVDVTDAAGVGDTTYGMGVACGDYDQDGDVDIYVTNFGPNVLYENNGKGKFTDRTKKLSVGDGRWGTSAAFVNVDGDADLDLFLVNNLNWQRSIETPCINHWGKPDYCSPTNYNAQSADVLYVKGRLGFQDASRRLGIHMATGNGLGVACADFDVDGDVDIYVANDASENVLWRNDGKDGFTNIALLAGCAVNANGTPEAGMGVQWVDIDQNGYPDLFMTHLGRETNTFYLNKPRADGRPRFWDRTTMTGLGGPSTKFTGFGMGFHDFDLDGHLDLYVANGAVQAWQESETFDPADPYAEPNHLYRGLGGVRFEFMGEGTAAPVVGTSRAAAFGDIDGDGDIDVVVVDRDAPLKILRNEAPRKGDWLGLRLLNKRGADAVGAAVMLETQAAGSDETQAQWRFVDTAYSYLASNDPRVVFGVPEGHRVVAVSVRWPGTTELERREGLATGSYHALQQK